MLLNPTIDYCFELGLGYDSMRLVVLMCQCAHQFTSSPPVLIGFCFSA